MSNAQTTLSIAGIILAAGSASRMKQPKLLLPWKGEALICHAVRVAINYLDPIIVVTGAWEKEVKAELADFGIKTIHNPEWQNGQSTSVRAGITALPAETSAVVFLLGDQPYVSSELIQGLVETYAATHPTILAPYVGEKRSNPVLFDRSVFDELCDIEGDVGARAIFKNHPITPYPWQDEKLLFDVDTPEDYQKLLEDS